MNLTENKAKAYDLVRKIEELNFSYNQQLKPLQEELQKINKDIYDEEAKMLNSKNEDK